MRTLTSHKKKQEFLCGPHEKNSFQKAYFWQVCLYLNYNVQVTIPCCHSMLWANLYCHHPIIGILSN